ncbi:MAG: hypothetical protein U0232_04930 [Thermomicrobiales bacterium]
MLTTMTDGWDDDDVTCNPAELRDAARRLAGQCARTAPSRASWRPSVATPSFVPLAGEFLNNLEEIATLATWAEAHGTERMTLSVSF